MTASATELDDLTQKLVSLGEDAEELSYWRDIFDDLTEEEQGRLLAGLREELAALETPHANHSEPGQTT